MNEHDSKRRDELSEHDELSARDAELAQRIAQTLQASTDALDADTRARLAALRHHALQRSRMRRVIGGLAVAASVLALVAMPWMLRHPAHEKVADDAAYLSVDPEMLADMDMLQAIGESQ